MKNIMIIFVVLLLFSCTEKAETTEDKSKAAQESLDSGNNELNEFNSMTITPENQKSFEGAITYKMSFKSSAGPDYIEGIKRVYGDSVTIYLSDKGYVMRYYNGSLQYVVYKWGNRQYTKFKQNDTLHYRDINQENTSLYSKLGSETDKVILGRKLNSVDLVTSGYEKIYYYDPNMHFNPQYFKNHAYGYEADYYNMAKAPYLYATIIYDKLTVTMEATSIQEFKIKNTLYDLPKLPVKKFED